MLNPLINIDFHISEGDGSITIEDYLLDEYFGIDVIVNDFIFCDD